MGLGGNTTNSNNYNFNKYKGGGVGASTISIRNAKNRLASCCNTGYTPCQDKIMPGGIFTTNAQLEEYRGVTNG